MVHTLSIFKKISTFKALLKDLIKQLLLNYSIVLADNYFN